MPACCWHALSAPHAPAFTDGAAGNWTIGPPYYRTEAGAHENSESAYGTFDQGGNVWEWNEAVFYGAYHGLRGGSFYLGDILRASDRNYDIPTIENFLIGFRVSEVPEPATIVMLALAGVGIKGRKGV